MNDLWILAAAGDGNFMVDSGGDDQFDQSSTGQDGGTLATGEDVPRQKQGNMGFILVMIAVMVVMYIMTTGGKRKQEKKHKQMVKSLQKNDRVRTIGGILGTVISVKEDEITLKIDESNNTKITVATTAIGKVLSNDN